MLRQAFKKLKDGVGDSLDAFGYSNINPYIYDENGKPRTQLQALKAYLDAGNEITNAKAGRLFGIEGFTARIGELRRMGYPLKFRVSAQKNRYGTVSRFKVWSKDGWEGF